MGHYRSELGLEAQDERELRLADEARRFKDMAIIHDLGKIAGDDDRALLRKVRLILDRLHVKTSNY